ncbi:molecular chaperone [Vibrio cholerae]|uniref:molecular chaperone n=1 Tax=Vibrio cholerae TaxID=666 RepID=UPI00287B077C|nr:molecular chaperone [Vibrio cholerae]EGR5566837.1 molecular chaperone [Vibrio cholerae]EGR5575181.1 molecular chaperone [Vibrio cholerae]EJL6510575.1 molecular chaperone [Vibrio cholerae]EJL9424473.1 molecular chaperone [Vibrio cholerae]EJN2401146.1 molecular chaperone [Vibrio cholerae]
MLISNSIYSSQNISNSNRNEVSENYRNNDNEINQLLENPPSLKNNVKLREAIAETATSNKEQEIADSLLGAIDDHTIQLEAISNWTEGGLSAFKGALEMIAQNMISNKPSTGEYGSYYEDLFQLVLMDVLANAEQYGFSDNNQNRNDVFMQFLSWSLEYIGTGQHNSWVETLPNPEDYANNQTPSPGSGGNKGNHLVKIADCVWYGIQKSIKDGSIPSNSLAARLMNFICENSDVNSEGISEHLPSSIYNNLYTASGGHVVSENQGFYNPNTGGWITNNNNQMSPLMRLTALSYILKDKEELSTSDVNTILYGSLEDINNLYKKLFNVTNVSQHTSESMPAPDIYHYIIRWNKGEPTSGNEECTDSALEHDNNGWQNCSANHSSSTRPNGVSISLDFAGELNISWLNDLSKNYPKRILGDEDIKEINRLGDSVKMIMQTLKYWFQIMRDERVAIARNI